MRLAGWTLAAIAAASVAIGGCGGGGSGKSSAGAPTVTVLVKNTDCAIKDITVSPFTVEQDTSGGALHLTIRATVKCNGQPLKGATLTFTIPGETAATTVDTGDQGGAETTPQNPGNKDLVGQDVGVAVTGADGKAYPQGTATVTKAP
ncbi:MAG TPA: hypothetical protein VNY33_05500 [Gaiellaceae bacterium]|nr:hypothetical protein [Gaiellaceae bacterium]